MQTQVTTSLPNNPVPMPPSFPVEAPARMYGQALRKVSTKSLDREQWLAIRKQGIGASDAAAAIGLSPYQSPLELWLIKTGRDAEMKKPDPNDDTSPMYWGNVLEPIVAQHYSKRTGNKVSVSS